VADAFDAITSGRPYREPRSRAEAYAEMVRNAGTQFDPACVEALGRFLDEAEITAERPALAS
jgi:HD-GYP domain-containing protein (c-di-GMP phosphodiesterase class II)